ncbi:hypothetical protein L226DRAFT_609807 [Lentinus tigrinus ALCF2SS1-7]|uniref:Uncharacterized protein n=1 Tax=Lentinus tigrinus ALCF2SS1-6 TaxID=1328759 RepID=A0A5C2SQA2_9APHY|nr:hypothetical protein L227DRAFT_649419 [Lentinus tigrinus ALCF2SS1-6]RPD79322.1 hypothetical protein L226DRAFT_609807 [Lentinus tigrinus ALCF2SS1-7]
MPERPASDSLWSFSLRSHNALDYCSSSDSEDGHYDAPQEEPKVAGKSDPASEEARLLQELDIGSRTDDATYKPNPWSIAKANAATRAPKPDPPVKRKVDTSRPSKAPQQTVMDLLRQQAKKTAHLPTEIPSAKTQTSPHPTGPYPQVSSPRVSDPLPVEDAHIPSDDTLVDSLFIETPCLPKLEEVAPTDIIPAPSSPRSPRIFAHSDGTNPPLPITAGLTSQPLAHNLPHTSSHAVFPHVESRPTQHHSSVPHGRDLRTMLFKPSTSSKPTASPSAPVLHGTLLPPATPFVNVIKSGPAPSSSSLRGQTPMTRSPLFKRERSSPDLPPPPSQYRAYYGSPSRPSAHSHSSPVPRRAYTPIPERSAYHIHYGSHSASSPIPSSSRARFDQEHDFSPKPSPTLTRFAFHPPSPRIRRMERHDVHDTPAPGPHHLAVCNESRASPSHRVSSRRQPKSPSLSPSPSPKRRGTTKQPKRDAYEAFSSPEDNWSTIPAKKSRNKSEKDGRPRDAVTKPFKMPIALGSVLAGRGRMAQASSAMTRGAKYMPPPPKNIPHRARAEPLSPSGPSSDAQSPFAYRHPGSPSRPKCDDGLSVPVLSPPSFRPMAIRRAPPLPVPLSSFRCPTPFREPMPQFRQPPAARFTHAATSSDTLSSDGRPHDEWDEHNNDERTVSFDTPTLARRYHAVRRGVAERKRLSAETWNILGLPSCGVVFRDEWKSGAAAAEEGGKMKKFEIVIVAWSGNT